MSRDNRVVEMHCLLLPGAFKEEKVRKLLGGPDNIRIVALIPLGYPADKETVSSRIARKFLRADSRKPFEEIVHFGKW